MLISYLVLTVQTVLLQQPVMIRFVERWWNAKLQCEAPYLWINLFCCNFVHHRYHTNHLRIAV